MQEIDLGARHIQNPASEIVEQKEPSVTIAFDEKVNWDDLPFTVAVNSERLIEFMRLAGLDDEVISKYKLYLHWSRSRSIGGTHSPSDKEIGINVNRFKNNKKKSQVSELIVSDEEMEKVSSILNGVLHHEVGHIVEPEEIRKRSVRQRVLMVLGSLSLPEASFLLKEMAIRRPSFDEAAFVGYVTVSLLLLTGVYHSSAAPNEIYARRFEHRIQQDKQWGDIIKLQPKVVGGA